MQLNLDTKNLTATVDGNKTYLLLLTGAAAIVLNHFGLIPPDYVPEAVKGGDWITQLFMLAAGATGRSALKKLEGDTMTPEQAAKAEAVATSIAKIGEALDKRQAPAG